MKESKVEKINVVATTISGSIKDWGKVKQIIPLFKEQGFGDVKLYEVGSHMEARNKTCELIQGGSRLVISAGGSGTFNAVLEGCCDSGVALNEITLGFLRKGSADLIGKALGMPDDITKAVKVFADSIRSSKSVKCDVLRADTSDNFSVPRHFVGYGGGEIFGEIPYFTENRFIKYYKGVLGQLFGDLGPFFVGASLSSLRKQLRELFGRKRKWIIKVNGKVEAEGQYQAFIIVNGDLGKDMPLAKDVPLGSGDFYMFALRDIGRFKLPGQFKETWNASIGNEPDKWGYETYRVETSLELKSDNSKPFEVNIDGSTMFCKNCVTIEIIDQINLISS